MSGLIWRAPGRLWPVFWLVLAGALAGVVANAETRAAPGASLKPGFIESIGVPDLIEVMREEGQGYGQGIGDEFLKGGGGAGWAAMVARIYDPKPMRAAVEAGLKAEISPDQQAELMVFFETVTGRRIVAKELEGRRAFLDAATEESAREAYGALKAAVEAGEDKKGARRLALLEAYVAANDLVEFNVAGALTANLRFFRGLIEGGAVEMSEEEVLDEVWGQEEEIREDTTEWLMAYLLMAYAPLSDDEIAEYVALSETPAGQALNRGLFAGFDGMYADLSYALGLAVAAEMKGEDL